MNPQNEDLKVMKRLEYMLNKFNGPLMNFPRPARAMYGETIVGHLMSAIANISIGNSVKALRLRHFQLADADIESFYVGLKFSRNSKFISQGFFKEMDNELTIIKSMLVKLIKESASSNRRNSSTK